MDSNRHYGLDDAFAKNRSKQFRAPIKRTNITISDEPDESGLVCSQIPNNINILKPFLEVYDGGNNKHKKIIKYKPKK